MNQHPDADPLEDHPDQPAETCHSCGEANPAGSRFCEHCGANLRSPRRGGRNRSQGKQLGRRRANKEIASIAGILKGVRGLFIVLACFYAGFFLLFLAGVAALQAEGVEGSLFVIPLLISGSVMLFSILGAAFLYRNPLAWSLALSCLLSLDVVWGFYRGGIPILGCVLMLISWSATIKISSIRGLLDEFSDTVAAQRLAGTRDRVEGGELTTRAKIRAARARSSGGPKVAAFVVGGILVFGLLVVVAINSGKSGGNTQTPEDRAAQRAQYAKEQLAREARYEEVLGTFVSAWKRSDLAGIAALINEGDERTYAMGKLNKSLERYGFEPEDLPRIDDRRDLWSRSGPVVKTYFRLPDMTGSTRAKLRINWYETDSKWEIVEVGLRKTSRD